MYIFQQAETPQGASCNCHRVNKVEISAGKVVTTISSFANETSEMLVWQDAYEIPMVIFSTGSYPQNVYDYLTGSTGPFSGAALIAEQDELTKIKLMKKASVNSLREQEINKGCDTFTGKVDTDSVSVHNIMAAYQSAVLASLTSQPFTIDWRLADNSSTTLDATGMIKIGEAVLARTQACYSHSWELKAEIDAATTADAVNAIVLSEGWPA